MPSGPFNGIRVLDAGRYISAPFCAAMMADLGADVIRIEPIGGADDRTVMPVSDDTGALHLHVNHSKRSLAIDLKHPDAQQIMQRLVRASDVVVTNMTNGILSRLRLDYDTLRSINPSVVHTNITAFGDTGPESESIGFDGTGQAMSGIAYLSGWPGQPTRSAASFVDYGTAMSAAFATAAALFERTRTGQGQQVKASLLGTALTMMNPILIEQALGARTRVATGNRSPIAGPSDIFRTTDGWIMVQVIGQDMFQRWAQLVGRPDLPANPLYADDIKRGENGEELSKLMQGWCAQRSSAECLAILRSARIPGCPVLSPQGALAERQHVEGGFFRWIDNASSEKPIPIVRLYQHNCESNPQLAPKLGIDSTEILLEIGFSEPEIESFIQKGIVKN